MGNPRCRALLLFVLLCALPSQAWLFKNRNWDSVEDGEAEKLNKPKHQAQKARFEATRSGTIAIPTQEALKDPFNAFINTKDARQKLLFADCFQDHGRGKYTCAMDPIQFFSAVIVPILNMTLTLDPAGSSASVSAISWDVRRGSKADFKKEGVGFGHAGDIDADSFQLTSDVKVNWAYKDPNTVEVFTEQKLGISMSRPSWIFVPNSVFNRAGNMIVGQILNAAIPDYLKGLKEGYLKWVAQPAAVTA